MARLLFSPIAGGGARSATFVVDGRTETAPGPDFDFATAGGLDVAFVQFDFPGNPVRSFPFDPLPVASLRLTDQPLPDPGTSLFDRDGDGRFERAALDLNPGHAIPRVEIGAFEGDFLTLSGWRDVGLDFATHQDDAAVAILGAEDASIALGAGDEELTVATADSGNGLITVAAAGGGDVVRLQAGGSYHGQALVSLGNGDDLLQVEASGDGGVRILADPFAATAADGTAGDGAAAARSSPDAVISSTTVSGSADAAAAGTTIFPPVPAQAPGGSFALAADGGQGDDRFVLASADATVSAGPGDDSIELGAASRATVAPGPGADTVVLRADAVATIVVARGETGDDVATADTLRFVGANPGPAGATVQLAGYGPGASARIETDAGTDGASSADTARLVVADPSGTDVVQLVGIDTTPLDALSVAFV